MDYNDEQQKLLREQILNKKRERFLCEEKKISLKTYL